jgi:large subunit ribosomal protein L31
MKPDIHPKYRYVVFRDINSQFQFLTKSTLNTRETTTYEGAEYPLMTIEVSADTHPFYTGHQKLMDTAGRVEQYYRRYGFTRPAEPTEG